MHLISSKNEIKEKTPQRKEGKFSFNQRASHLLTKIY